MTGSFVLEDSAVIRRLIKAVDPEAPIPKQLVYLEHQAKTELIQVPAENRMRIVILTGYVVQEMMLAYGVGKKLATKLCVEFMLMLKKKIGKSNDSESSRYFQHL
jgi:hypothetical protein